MRVHKRNGRARVKMFLDVASKRDLMDMLDTEGFSLESEKHDVGEWNEGMYFYAVKNEDRLLLDNAGKGERRDWQGMWNAFCDEMGLDRD